MTILPFDLFLVLWNRRQGYKTPALHLQMARWLTDCWRSHNRHLLLMAFRSSGKSTLVGLFAAWLLYQDNNLRIMVLAADLALAKKMVRNVKRIIERHPLTGHLKPARADQWAANQFTISRPRESRDPSMMAQAIGTNITGSRADIVICDDVEVPNTSATAGRRADLRERLIEIDFVLVPGGLILYVGTPHHYYSIYADHAHLDIGEDRPFLDGYQRLVIPVLNADGQSAWPDRFPMDAIHRIRTHSGPARFQSQMMLQPTNSVDGRLNPDLLVRYDDELVYHEAQHDVRLMIGERRMVSCSCWWDPAFGSAAGDASVVAIVYSDGMGRYYLHRIKYLRINPRSELDEATQQCQLVADFIHDLYVPSITIETNGIGQFLPGLLRRELLQQKSATTVLTATSTRAKSTRILEAFDAVLAAGALHVHRSVLTTPFMREMREWQGIKQNSADDGLDAVAGALLNEPVRLGYAARIPSAARPDWRGSGALFNTNTDFEV